MPELENKMNLMSYSWLIGLALAEATFAWPWFLATYLAPNRKWLLVALAIGSPILVYLGHSSALEPCTGMFMPLSMPEASDGWFVELIALFVGAALRMLQLVVGGWSAIWWVRVITGVVCLPSLILPSYSIVRLVEHLTGMSPCVGE